MVTDSQNIFESAQKDLKHVNAFGYPERLNPLTDVRIKESSEKCLGDLSKSFFSSLSWIEIIAKTTIGLLMFDI